MQLPGYEVDKVLGKGGMATVYLGRQLSLDRPVAIKVLKAKLVEEAAVQSQFQQESLMVAQLNHPNIIQVIDQGESAAGLPYFVMQYVKGIPLISAISRDDVTLTRKLDIAIQICKALSYAHRNGVVHRDIKPANVLVDYEGHVRVVDFGIAGYFKQLNQSKDKPQIIFGTPAYMAPEQSELGGEVTHLSDIYAFGVLMHELFLGCKPKDFEKKPAALPTALMDLIHDCTNKDKTLRPQTADEIRQRLLRILQGKHLKTTKWESEKTQDVISSQYTLLDVMKENGFGATYLVSEPKRERLLVVKKQMIAYSGNALAVNKLLARQNHPHIATIHGTAQNDTVFITVMEYIEGGSLEDRLTQAFSLERWLALAIQICKALSVAHEQQVIHGNLRPSNVLVVNPSHIKLTDFGFKDHSAGSGVDWYQPAGEEKTIASDIYSAGAVLFHLLTGQQVQQGTDGPENQQALEVLPQTLRDVLLKMLKTSPQDRYDTIGQVCEALESFTDNEETIVFIPSKSAKPVNRRKQTMAKVVFVAVSLLLLAELAWFFSGGFQQAVKSWFQ